MSKIVHAACSHDCPDACGILITINDQGQATKLRGDPDHPVTRGFLCAKVAKYLDRVYSPDRVLYPLKRVAPKGGGARGSGDFVRITWEEALEIIAGKLRRAVDEFGSESILPYSYAGTTGSLGYGSMDRRFFHRLGASQLDRTICATAGGEALVSVVGRKLGTDPEHFRHSKYILAWGANIHGNNVHLWPFIEEARRAGAKLVVIDPYKTRTAQCADWYLPIHPGTDVALALAMMHVIFRDNLHDADYCESATLGFEALRERAAEYPPDRVAGWTGISAADIERLAREYATVRPAVIRVNYGVQRSENGGSAVRAITMLPCITGSWKEHGGGLQLSTSGAFKLNDHALERPDLMLESSLKRASRVVNMSELGIALTQLGEPPVKALFVYNSNPAAVAPNHNDVVRGLLRPDLFTVVHEQFYTDTTDYADVVLPATTFFEHKELQRAYGHYYLQISNPAIRPLGECKPNIELFSLLAQKMDFPEECFRDGVDQMIDAALDSGDPWMAGISRERLEREDHVRLSFEGGDEGKPFLPFADGKFPTPSGKAELYNERLAELHVDPIVKFVPPTESRHGESAGRYPLELLSRKADNYLNSTFCNVPSLQKMEHPDLLEISVLDAASRGIKDGDAVRVFNSRGESLLEARVNGTTSPGVVAALLNWAKLSENGKSINALTSEKLTDIGRGATFYSCLVEVEKLAGQFITKGGESR